MIIAAVIENMIAFYRGSQHDIDHFLKVWALAKTIGELEGLDAHTQQTLKPAAIVHDIACPLCRAKYSSANGKMQELESPPLVREFFAALPVSTADVERIVWLAAHHHTYTDVDGPDHQILLEADYLTNAGDGRRTAANIAHTRSAVFRTAAGIRLLDVLYPPEGGVTGRL